jgi:hypothetical protein
VDVERPQDADELLAVLQLHKRFPVSRAVERV